jgi:hypothetical protein
VVRSLCSQTWTPKVSRRFPPPARPARCTNLRHLGALLSLWGIKAEEVAQVEKSLLMADQDGLEVRLPEGELHASRIAQGKFRDDASGSPR